MRKSYFRLVLFSTSALVSVSLVHALHAQEVIDGTHETVIGDGSGTRPANWDIGNSLTLGDGSGTESVLEISQGGRVTNTTGVLGQNSDASVVVSGAGSAWETSGALVLGSGDGTTAGLTIANGGTVQSGETSIGSGVGSQGDVVLTGSGSAWIVNGDLRLGDEGHASVLISDGAEAETSALRLTAAERSAAMVTISGQGSSLIMAGSGYISGGGTNALTIEDGGALISASMQISGTEDNAALVTVTGENSIWESRAGGVVVGDVSDGELELLDGGRLEAGNVTVGRNGKGRGTVTINGDGSALTTRANLIVGQTGVGDVLLSDNGVLETGGQTVLGSNEDGKGTIDLRGAGVRWAAEGPVTLGQDGEGSVSAQDGAHMSMQSLVLGAERTGSGVLQLEGTDTLLAVESDLVIGQSGGGAVMLADGARMTARSLVMGSAEDSGGELILYGGHLSLEETMEIGRDGVGAVALVENGSLTAAGGLSVGSDSLFFIGAPKGRDLYAPGTLTTPSLLVETGGELILNHSSEAYLLETDLSGSGHMNVAGGSTTLRSGTGFAGTVGIDEGATLTAASSMLTGPIENEGRLVFDESEDGIYGGLLSGSGEFVKAGAGQLTVRDLSGFHGNVAVEAGRFSYDGLFDGALSVSGSGILSGAGTFNSLDIQNGGIFAPGNSIGTSRVSGGLAFGAGSVYEVEVDSSGNSDLTIVENGTTIDSAASVAVLAENRTDTGAGYAAETTYTILQSSDGITGTFGSVTDTFAFLSAELTYDPTSVYLTLARSETDTPEAVFAAGTTTRNQRTTSAGVASLGSGTLFDAVLLLPDGETEAAFDALSGEAHASVRGQLSQDVRPAQDAVERRIRSGFDSVAALGETAFNGQISQDLTGGWQLWGEVYGAWGERDGSANSAGYTRSGGGLVAGVDKAVSSTWRLGAFGGFGTTSFDVDARASSGNTTNLTAGVYSGHLLGAINLHAGSSLTWHGVDMTRSVRFTGLNETLTSDYSAWTGQLFAEAAYTVEFQQVRVSPFLGASIVSTQSDGFSEKGGSAALKVSSGQETTGTTTLGVRGETAPLLLGESFLHFSGSLAWRHTFGDVTPANSMRFDGGNAFTVSGTPIDRDTAQISAAMTWSHGSALSLDLGYTGEFGNSAQDHGARAGFSLEF
ncbi:autotransporter domain-containing protein [Roseibium sp.]|uniref:autotransporter domain-containing protein n=1 Tax=Roseibium sp. TaxID=1936156 RepID=UPI003BAFDA4E